MSGICDICITADTCEIRRDGRKLCAAYERNSNYNRLFGTPERAARTMEEFELDQISWCRGTDCCEKCPYEFDRYGCCLPDGFSLLEWLGGDAE